MIQSFRGWAGKLTGGMEAIACLGSFLWAVWIVNPDSQFMTQSGLRVLRTTGEVLVGANNARYLWSGFCMLAVAGIVVLSLVPMNLAVWKYALAYGWLILAHRINRPLQGEV